jgi:hypothetical protein
MLFGMLPCSLCIFCGIKFILVERQEELTSKALEEPIENYFNDGAIDENPFEEE